MNPCWKRSRRWSSGNAAMRLFAASGSDAIRDPTTAASNCNRPWLFPSRDLLSNLPAAICASNQVVAAVLSLSDHCRKAWASCQPMPLCWSPSLWRKRSSTTCGSFCASTPMSMLSNPRRASSLSSKAAISSSAAVNSAPLMFISLVCSFIIDRMSGMPPLWDFAIESASFFQSMASGSSAFLPLAREPASDRPSSA